MSKCVVLIVILCVKAELREAFVLWGLTLSMLNDFLMATGFRDHKIDEELMRRLDSKL